MLAKNLFKTDYQYLELYINKINQLQREIVFILTNKLHMKKTYLLIITCLFTFVCNSQNNTQVVSDFIKSYNEKDSLKTFSLLHKDFVELWEKDTVINNKTAYSKNYSWGKVMNDANEIEIVKTSSDFVEAICTYTSDRDNLLGVAPYKSKRVYQLKNGKIFKIIGGEFNSYNEYDKPRREKYQLFFKWLSKNYNLNPSSFPFDKNGAERLKKILIEYNNK